MFECVFRPCLQYDDLFKTFTDCGSAFLKRLLAEREDTAHGDSLPWCPAPAQLTPTQNKTKQDKTRQDDPLQGGAVYMGMLSLSSCVLIMMVTKFEQEVQMKHVPFYILKKDQIDRRWYDTCEIQTKINTSDYVYADVYIYLLCTSSA